MSEITLKVKEGGIQFGEYKKLQAIHEAIIMSLAILYVTHENEQEAERVVSHLLENNLVACANMFPIESAFQWKGGLQKEREVVTILKTREESWQKVRDEIEKVHPYEPPCIVKFKAEANGDFEEWVRT